MRKHSSSSLPLSSWPSLPATTDCLDGLENDPPKLPLERYRILKELEELVRLHVRTEWQAQILEDLKELRNK